MSAEDVTFKQRKFLEILLQLADVDEETACELLDGLLSTHAHALAGKIRAEVAGWRAGAGWTGQDYVEESTASAVENAADLIDPEVHRAKE